MSLTPWYDQGLRFSCTQCGNCCTGPPGYVWFNQDEGQAMAQRLGLSEEAFYGQYARWVLGRWSLKEVVRDGQHDCVFLVPSDHGGMVCSVYDDRPTQCRTWPFWPENLDTLTDWEAAGKRCPGMGRGELFPVDQIRIIRDRNR